MHLVGLDASTTVRYVKALRTSGISRVEITDDRGIAMETLDEESGIVIMDYDQNDPMCPVFLEYLRMEFPQISPIMITRSADLRTVVDALRYGALDHVVQGEGDEAHLEAAVGRIIRMKDLLNADRGELWNQISNRINAA